MSTILYCTKVNVKVNVDLLLNENLVSDALR